MGFKADKEYIEQLNIAKTKTNQNDAINCYSGRINNNELILSVMNFEFIGGSMGSVVGELVSRSIDLSRDKKIPLVLICSSGGARMQESAYSLMQLAKTSSRLARFQKDGGLYISYDYLESVQNISLSGLGVSQYYSTYSQRFYPYQIFCYGVLNLLIFYLKCTDQYLLKNQKLCLLSIHNGLLLK